MNEKLNIIKELDIRNFRGFQEQKLELGQNVTIIFGQNGTLKSTLLGMIAQPFYFSKGKSTLYTDDYLNETENSEFDNQINGKPFESKYSQIFKMSDTDISAHGRRRYEYYIRIEGPSVKFSKDTSGDDKKLLVRSQYAKESTSANRFRLVGGGTSHKRGAGNFPHPVIFLGLNRLYPLALSTFDEKNEIVLSEGEKAWYNTQYSYILSTNDSVASVSTSSPKEGYKPAYVLHSDEICNYQSASAGQDNVGQVISAILSFKRLKEKMGDSYRGGLLLIDEMDATLHPIAQKKMLSFLVKSSKDFGIQVVATSHSSNVLEEAFFSSGRQYVRSVKIDRVHNKYQFVIHSCAHDVSYNDIYKDLFHSFGTSVEKPLILLEDSSAEDCLKVLLGSSIYKNLTVSSSTGESASCSYLKWLASYDAINKKMPILVVLDGDQTIGAKIAKRAIALPGNNYPEAVLYDFFMNSYDWTKNSLKLDFSSDACFEDYRESDRLCSENHVGETKKELHKRWYLAMSKKERLGQGCGKGWKAYKEVNCESTKTFVTNFLNLACNILKGRPKEYRFIEDVLSTTLKKLTTEQIPENRVDEISSITKKSTDLSTKGQKKAKSVTLQKKAVIKKESSKRTTKKAVTKQINEPNQLEIPGLFRENE